MLLFDTQCSMVVRAQYNSKGKLVGICGKKVKVEEVLFQCVLIGGEWYEMTEAMAGYKALIPLAR